MSELSLEIRYEQLLGKSIAAGWKGHRERTAKKEAHARKLALVDNGISSIASAMAALHGLLSKACLHLAINDTPSDVHSIYLSWLIASDLKSVISVTDMKVGDLKGAALSKSIFNDVTTQVKIEVKQQIENDGNYSLEDAEQLMDEWFYFVSSKSVGKAPTETSTSQNGKEGCIRIVYDVYELMIDGKAIRPIRQLKPFVELSDKARQYIEGKSDEALNNSYKGTLESYFKR